MKRLVPMFVLACVLISFSAFAQQAEKAKEAPAAEKAPAAQAAQPAAEAKTEAAPAEPAKAEPAKAEPAKTEPAKAEPKVDEGLLLASKLIKQAKAAADAVKTMTCKFHKQEYKGKQWPKEEAMMKWRRNPRSIYMKWVGKEKTNQETIWRKGWNDNKIRAHKGSFPDVTANLKTDSWMAMRDNRHPVVDAGFDHTIYLIQKDINYGLKHPESISVKNLGLKKVFGRKSQCFESTTDKKNHKEYYGYKAVICMDAALKTPSKVQIWDLEDDKVRKVEDYGYSEVVLNPPLTDADFDPENEKYNF